MDDFDLSSGGETWCDRGDGCCKHCGEKLDAHAAKSHWCPLPLFVLDEGEPQPTEPQDAAA